MRQRIDSILFCLFLLGVFSSPAWGGGSFETIDITGRVPSPISGLVIGKAVPRRWDTRCLPVQFRVNDTLDPIPNPLGPPVLTVVQAIPVLQQALDVWNDVPTSFIEMEIGGTTSNPGEHGFDMVSEIAFQSSRVPPGLLAFTFHVFLLEDSVLVDGDDLDGDGDPDISSAISICTDIDSDGDIEFPAGFYKAGTILESDVVFSSDVARFTLGPPDATDNSMDLMGVAVHEFGHAHGLAHSLTNQISAIDGRGAAMFPFFNVTDPEDELSFRSLTIEDIAWSSFFYPEGSAASGPAALEPGDVAFDNVFGRITGEVRHGILNRAIAGANVFAVENGPGGVDTIVSSGFSGTLRFHVNPLTNAIESSDLLDGNYTVPVPRGRFKVGVEPRDELPAPGAGVNLTEQFGRAFGGHDFNEEFLKRGRRPRLVEVKAGRSADGIDIVTSGSVKIDHFASHDVSGFVSAPAGRYYAVRIPAAEIMAAFETGVNFVIESSDFLTAVADSSVVPVFAEAQLTTGTVNPDGSASLDLVTPLRRVRNFAGQDLDLARFIFRRPERLTARVRRGVRSGRIENLFLVLRVPTSTPFPGTNALPPLIGLDGEMPIFGLSYVSDDGGVTFTRRTDRNFMFRLVLRLK